MAISSGVEMTNGTAGKAPKELRGQIATTAVDITAPYMNFILTSRDEVLARRGGGQGLKIYQDLMRDPHVRSVMGKRRLAVVAREWSVEPASDAPQDQQAAALVKEAYERIAFDRATLGLLGCLLTGFAVAEVVWETAELPGLGGTWLVPAAIKTKNARRFVFDRDSNLRLLTPAAPSEGEVLPERKFLVARYGEEETEDPYGLGLGNALFWPVFFKRQGIAYWNVFAEKFAQPTPVGEYEQGTPESEQAKLLAFLSGISNQAAITVPKGTAVRFLEATRSGSIDCYERLVEFMNAEISKAVVGQTLTTQMGANGSRAASETHKDVQDELTDADCDLLSEVIYQLSGWIVELNIPGARPPQVWRERPDEEDLNTRVERDTKVKALGFEPSLDYIQRTYGEAWTPRQPNAPADPGRAAFAAPAGGDAVDGLVEELLADWEPTLRPAVDQIMQAAEAATSAEDFMQRLSRLAVDMDLSELVEALARGTFAGHLAGRAGAVE
jgi:phage gp29-like protein